MASIHDHSQDRMLRVFTDQAIFDGLLKLTLLGRTLDELNSSSRIFLLLDSPTLADGDGTVLAPQIAINKSSILFAMELDDFDAVPGSLPKSTERKRSAQSVLMLRVADYDVQGNVHVFQTGNPLARIYLPGHPFVALTAVSVGGPGLELSTPFLAVNRAHVLTGLESCRLDAVMVDPSGSETISPRT